MIVFCEKGRFGNQITTTGAVKGQEPAILLKTSSQLWLPDETEFRPLSTFVPVRRRSNEANDLT